MDTQKIIDRIRKLLSMSNDSSSPAEAAIAARRASVLLEKHNLDRAEVLMSEMTEDDMIESTAENGYSAVPKWVGVLAIPVANLHDCQAQYTRGPRGKHVKFQGMKEDALVATWVFQYLIEEINRLAEAYRKRTRAGRSEMFDFRLGASYEILKMLNSMNEEREKAQPTTGKELVVCKQQLVQQKFGMAQYKSSRSRYRASEHHAQGRRAGAGVSIHKAVHGTSRTAIGG